MDDRQTYLLNGLLARHFSLGRIVRFRPVQRGRQGEAFELFTAQEKEYLAVVLPAAYEEAELSRVAGAVNALDDQRFSVVPFVQTKAGGFVAEGPQNGRLMVSLAPEGSAMAAEHYTEHDISQVGLRLAWMHRLFEEQLPKANAGDFMEEDVPEGVISAEARKKLLTLARQEMRTGWAHGGIRAEALLHDSDHQLRSVVDWADLHYGSPLEDVVGAFVFLTSGGDDRGQVLLEAYRTLLPLRGIEWGPIVAGWCWRTLAKTARQRAGLPRDVVAVAGDPEALAKRIEQCL